MTATGHVLLPQFTPARKCRWCGTPVELLGIFEEVWDDRTRSKQRRFTPQPTHVRTKWRDYGIATHFCRSCHDGVGAALPQSETLPVDVSELPEWCFLSDFHKGQTTVDVDRMKLAAGDRDDD